MRKMIYHQSEKKGLRANIKLLKYKYIEFTYVLYTRLWLTIIFQASVDSHI